MAEYTLLLRVLSNDPTSSDRFSGEHNKTLKGYTEQPSRLIAVRYGMDIMQKEINASSKYGDKTVEQEEAEVVDGEINRLQPAAVVCSRYK